MISPRRRHHLVVRRLARLGLFLACALLSAYAVAETAWGRQKLRVLLCDVIRSELGLEARLAYVRVQPSLFPPGIDLVARGIELSHPREGRLVVASRLSVRPSLTRLLTGHLDLTRIELRSPHVRLVFRDGVLANGPSLPPSEGGASDLPIRYLAIENGAVRVVGDAPVTGFVEGLSVEVAAAGGRAMSVDLRARNGRLYHPRGEEPLDDLLFEGAIDLDRGLHVARARVLTPTLRLALRDASMSWELRANGTIDARLDVTRLGRTLARDLGVELTGVAEVHGRGYYGGEHYGGSGHLVLDHVAIRGRGLGSPLELDFVANEHEVRVREGVMHMPHAGGTVGLEARVGLASPYPIEARLDFRRMQFPTLMDELGITPDSIVRWNFDGPASLHGQGVPFRLTGGIDVETSDFFVSSGPWHATPPTRIIGVPRGHIRGRVEIDSAGLGFRDLDLVTEHSRVQADTFISFGSTFDVRAHSEHLDLADVSPLTTFPLTGVGTIDVHVGGLYSDAQLEAAGVFRGFSFDGMPLGDLELSAGFEEGGLVVRFPEIRAVHGESRYRVRDLRLDFTESMEIDADVELESVLLADLYRTFHLDEDERFEPYQGLGTGHAHAHYTYGFPGDSPTGTLVTDLDLALPRTSLAGYAFEDGHFRGQLRWYDQSRDFDGAELDVDEFTLRKGPATLAIAGTIRQEGALDLRVVADRIAIEDVEGLGDSWPLLAGEIGVLGTISNDLALPHLDLDVTLSDVTWAGRPVGDGRAYVKLTDAEDPWITAVRGADPDAPDGLDCVRGRQGLLNADWPPDPPRRTPDGPVQSLARPEAFVICGSGLDGALDLDLMLGYTDVAPHRGRIAFHDLDLTPFLPASAEGGAPHGRVTGHVDLTAGDVLVDRTSTGRVRLDALELAFGGVTIANRGPWDVELVRGTARFSRAAIVGNGTELSLSGTASATELALALEGSVGMELFAAASPSLASAAGSTDLRIFVRGPLADPEVVGEATFAGVSFEHASLPVPVTDVAGRIEFSQRRIVLDRIAGHLGSGTITLDGSAAIDGGLPSSLRVRAELEDVALRPEDGIELAFGGSLEATWDRSRELPLVRGTIELDRARYSRPVQVTPTLGELTRPTRAEVDVYDPAGDLVELDVTIVQRTPFEVRNNLVDLDVTIEDDERPFRIVGTNQRVGVLGTLGIPRGRVFFRGSSFDVRRGTIELDDPHRIHSRFDVLATTEIRRNYDSTAPAFRISLAATGDSDAFRLDASSTPSLSQQDIMLLLMVGMTSSELQNLQASQLSTAALDALSTLTGVQSRISEALRVVDEVSLTTMYHPVTNRPEPQLTVGSRITDRIRVTASTGLTTETRTIRTTAEWRLDDRTSVQAVYDNINRETASAFGNLGVDVRYRLEFQ